MSVRQRGGGILRVPILINMDGQKLGGYEIVTRLGAGGMGTVYKARDPELDRFVAIKVLAPALMEDPVCIERFKREARAIAGLHHPNLMHVYTVGTENSVHYFAMEYIDGRPLSKYCAQWRQTPLAEVVRVSAQIMGALAKAHGAGVIHRDLKPANVMIDNDGRAVVLDFGLSKDTSAMNLTGTGTIMGTPDYMAPEQIEGEEVTPATDVYALGVMIYEMLTGNQPFHRKSPILTMRAHCEDKADPIEKFRSDLPPIMEKIIRKAIAKKPAERFQSMQSFARAMTKVSNDKEMLAVSAGGASAMRHAATVSASAVTAVVNDAQLAPTMKLGKSGRTKTGRRTVTPKDPEGGKGGISRKELYVTLGGFLFLVIVLTIAGIQCRNRRRDERKLPPPKESATGNEQGNASGVPGKTPVSGGKTGDTGSALPREFYIPAGKSGEAVGVAKARLRLIMRDGKVHVGNLVAADGKTITIIESIDGKQKSFDLAEIRAIAPATRKRQFDR